MKPLLITVFAAMFSVSALAHPGSGIVVDVQGNVYVSDINRGLLKFTPGGKVTVVLKEAGHWLALDAKGSFAAMDFQKSSHWPRWFKHRNPAGGPALVSDGGSPLVILGDGNLYYICDDERMIPGGLQIARLSPIGELGLFGSSVTSRTGAPPGGMKGLAGGPDGSIYAITPGAVLNVPRQGTFKTVLQPVTIPGCDRYLPPNTPAAFEPFLSGISVSTRGEIYLAATGCRSVVKLDSRGRISTVLKSESPWAPTGIAFLGEDVYVAEWTNAHSEAHDYRPRVRKVDRTGKVTTIGEFPE